MENPEKYISIEYDKWLNYYKPLEENYNKLERELKEEKQRKDFDLHISLGRLVILNKYRIGVIKFSITPEVEFLDNTIQYIIKDKLREFNLSGYVTEDDVIKSLGKLKEEEYKFSEKVNKIPKIIRKIFKINNK